MDYPIKTLSQLRPILKGFRKAAGMTQAAVADHLGVTQQTYAQLEANPTAVSIERLFKVLQVLGVNLVLIPVGAESAKNMAAVRPSPAGARPPVRKTPARKGVSTAAPTNARQSAPSAAKMTARSSAGAAEALRETGKRRAPPKAVIKKRENW